MKPALLSIALWFAVAACSSGPTTAERLEAEKGAAQTALGVAVATLEERPQELPTLVRRNIAGHAALRPSDLWNLQVYAATLRGQKGDLIRATLLKMPLTRPWQGAALYLAFDGDGRLLLSGASGHAIFDQDRDQQWSTFLRQFKGRLAAPPSAFLTSLAAHNHWQEVQQGATPELATARALYEQKRLMVANDAMLTRVTAATGRGELPAPGLLRDWLAMWDQIEALGPQLAPLVGTAEAHQYPDFAAESREILAAATRAAAEGDAATLRRQVGGELGRRSCKSCHQLASSTLGGALRPSLETRLSDFGAPDLWRVNRDLWAPASLGATAQPIASRVKAGLMLMGEIRRQNAGQGPL